MDGLGGDGDLRFTDSRRNAGDPGGQPPLPHTRLEPVVVFSLHGLTTWKNNYDTGTELICSGGLERTGDGETDT